MTALLNQATTFIDDRINPIVVKELRQAVKSRFIVGVLLLMLALLVSILLLYVMNSTNLGSTSSAEGGNLFAIFQGTLLGVCMLFVPIYLGARLTAERSSATSDLMYVTTLRPSSIIWGKLVAGMAVAGMIFAVCAPFMVVTYLLRGIDPPTILFVLTLDAMVVLSASMLAIFLGAMPVGWPVKILLGLIAGAIGFYAFAAISFMLIWQVASSGVGGTMGSSTFWWGVVGVGSFWLSIIGLFFFLSVAMIAPATSNRGLSVRLYLSAAWLISAGVFFGFSLYYSDSEAMTAWAMSWAFVLLPALLISTSERDAPGPRLRRSIPRNVLLRVPAFLHFSGAAGGMLWAAGLFTLTLLIALLCGEGIENSGYDMWQLVGMMKLGITGLFVLGYALLGVALRRAFLADRPRLQVATAGIVFVTMMFAMIIPMIVVFALYPQTWDNHSEKWLFLNPLAPLMHHDANWRRLFDYDYVLLAIAAAMTGLGALVNVPWFVRQVRAFTPLRTAAAGAALPETPRG